MRGTYPYSGAQMDFLAPEGISVVGYPLHVVAPWHAAYAMGKVALGTRQGGRHGATMGSL